MLNTFTADPLQTRFDLLVERRRHAHIETRPDNRRRPQ